MRFKLFFQFLFITPFLSAQTFTELPQSTPFEAVWYSSVAFSDVDGDGDEDVLITGQNNFSMGISKLYINDGMGNFSEMMGSSFDGVELGSVAFSDVDGDGDNDVLLTGQNNSKERISKLYINDGAGNFSEMMGTSFDGVMDSSVAFSDVDSDGDEDVLLTGQDSLEQRISKLYTNDGLGNFSEMMGTPFDGVGAGFVAFSDVDSDGDEDVLLTGQDSSGLRISKLYTNDGMGNFSEMTVTPFDGVWAGSVAFSDVDADGDEDVLLTGLNNSSEIISKLYTNDGMGNFSEMTSSTLEGAWAGSAAFSDVDGDGDEDVLITGQNGSGALRSKLYTNDGVGNFSEIMGSSFDAVGLSSVAFSDVDGDGDEDVLITGENSSFGRISKLYTNDGVVSSTDNLSIQVNLDFIPYPNPTNLNNLYINYDSAENEFVTLKVYDLNGHLLSQQKEFVVIGQKTFSINIASLIKGSYFVELDNGERRGVIKFIVQ